jgi:23S rRNA (uracil1939-C5)-methyltransferase
MELTIEKMIYGGDGLSRTGATAERRGKSVFLPFVLAGERVEAKVTEEKPGFMRAWPEKIISASAERVQAPCPYFARCGGCHYQHASYEQQLRIKESVLRETLLRGAKLDWQDAIHIHPSPPWNYRNRTRMKVSSNPFALGYYRVASHELQAVEQCPISSALINRAITAVWELGRAGAAPDALAEIEFFANAEDTELLAECYLRRPGEGPGCGSFYDALKHTLPELKGLASFAGQQAAEPAELFGAREMQYRTACGAYRVSAGSFFQTDRFLIDALIETALTGAEGARALDLFAGTGLFAAQLAKNFQSVTAVEVSQSSFADLKANCPENVHTHQATTERFFEKLTKSTRFDFVLVDPPRAGLGNRVAERLAKLAAPTVTYVSCDPATLARDLRILLAGGYRVREIHLLDLFPQTYHLETVLHLLR